MTHEERRLKAAIFAVVLVAFTLLIVGVQYLANELAVVRYALQVERERVGNYRTSYAQQTLVLDRLAATNTFDDMTAARIADRLTSLEASCARPQP